MKYVPKLWGKWGKCFIVLLWVRVDVAAVVVMDFKKKYWGALSVIKRIVDYQPMLGLPTNDTIFINMKICILMERIWGRMN